MENESASMQGEKINAAIPDSGAKPSSGPSPRRIPGNLPYLTASGSLKRVLEKIQEAARPEKFNADFLENVLKMGGGSARATIPILKKMGFLQSDGSPTELYAKFRTGSGKAQAAATALRNAFPEIFKRSEYAYAADDSKLKDIIVEITGLKSSDTVAAAIRSTFNVIKSYIPSDFDSFSASEDLGATSDDQLIQAAPIMPSDNDGKIRLAYKHQYSAARDIRP